METYVEWDRVLEAVYAMTAMDSEGAGLQHATVLKVAAQVAAPDVAAEFDCCCRCGESGVVFEGAPCGMDAGAWAWELARATLRRARGAGKPPMPGFIDRRYC